jgi:short-subunit dehydrogenase
MQCKVAVVTGGASGMGREFAIRMAAQGIRVAVLDRDEAALSSMQTDAAEIMVRACDVTRSDSVEAILAEVTAELGPIDRLVHCAAIMPTGRLIDRPTEEIQHLMTVNYGGTVNVVKAIVPRMQARDSGQIVIFGSTGGSVLVPECGAYCASKAATNAFAEVLIEELRETGLQVMLVCPPLVDTPLLSQALETSNPRSVRDSIKHKRFVTAGFVIDAVEAGLASKAEILIPGAQAKLVMWARRIAPRLLWKVVNRANADS